MEYQDKVLICKDCQLEFIFSAGEQKFFEEKELQNVPQRCPDCRKRHKKGKKPGGQAIEIKCRLCGKTGRVSFPVSPEEKIYCGDCFPKAKEAGFSV